MAISAVNNETAFSVFKDYQKSYDSLQESMSRLSRGTKSVLQDPSSVGISERMRAQTGSTGAARQNVQNSLSALQTADSWMQNMSNMLGRMHELSVMARDGIKTSSDIENLNTEFSELQDEIARIANEAATFNGKNLLNGEFSGVTVQIGPDSNQEMTVNLSDLGTSNSDTVATVGGASVHYGSVIRDDDLSVAADAAISGIQGAISEVANQRANLGGQMSRMQETGDGLLTYEDNLRAAESNIRDIDAARESTRMAQNQIQTQIGSAMLTQANQVPSSLVQLIG